MREPIAHGFADREEAGRALADLLRGADGPAPVVLGLPRGGVPVAAEVARALDAPLDAICVRKIGAPSNPEYGIGAVAEGGQPEIAPERVTMAGEGLEAAVQRARAELADLVLGVRDGRPPIDLHHRTAIIVDDGIATGATVRAAAHAARARGAERVVIAVPVAHPAALRALAGDANRIVAVLEPPDLGAVGLWYGDFAPVSERRVRELLDRGRSAPTTRTLRIGADDAELVGDLAVPEGAVGLVVFAHGSGSSRLSPRNRMVAEHLRAAGLGTLLLDLLTPAEAEDRSRVFDIALLARRLGGAIRWAAADPDARDLPLALFGASTGAGAALHLAADEPERVRAVVSRGGRPDLAGPALPRVRQPVLLIVGAEDRTVLDLNRAAQTALGGPSELVVVPGATHLFEEPGALEEVAETAARWLRARLA